MAKENVVSKILSKLPAREETKAETPQKVLPKLKLVFIIVDWEKANIVSNVLTDEKVRFHFTSKGTGTAASEIMDLLGVDSPDKAVIICLEQEVGVPVLLKEIRKKLRAGPGVGIAFSSPLSAINDPIMLFFKQSILKNEKIPAQGEGVNMANQYSHDLILCIVNHGNSDEVMDTARSAGARGGTVINARGTAHEGTVKFFGISIQDEKEVILILTEKENKTAIMSAVCDKHGLNSKTQGIVFSMPVDSVMGLSME